MSEPEWYRTNRANWDERVGVHLGSGGYDLSELRGGRGKLNAIEEAELPPVGGKRLAHLQCHFGADSLTLAQRGAEVVGLDFSAPAIQAAHNLPASSVFPTARDSLAQTSMTRWTRSRSRTSLT